MKKHISYPKILQFRNVIQSIDRQVCFAGLDEETGEPIYDPSLPKPVIKFKGTVKLHGTNASVCYNETDGFWAQSRNGIITPEKDNAGFALFAYSKKGLLSSILNSIAELEGIDISCNTITMYGEWAGKGVQKSVAVSELDKAFYVFGVKVTPDSEDDSYWIEDDYFDSIPLERIYTITSFPTYEIDVDMKIPQLAVEKLQQITEEVEKECPVAKHFGVSGIGEGVVWSAEYKGSSHRFKVKGEKHSVTKVKKLASVDVEKLTSINEFVEYAVTKQRVSQAIQEVFKGEELVNNKIGDLIRWVIKDINSEEMDTLVKNNLEPKDVNKYISTKTREMFFEEQNKF